jgi:O-antigen/teichoic acid export membrane protein
MSDQRSTRRTENIGTGVIVAATAFSALAVLAFQVLGSRSLGTDAFAPIAVLWTLTFLIYTVLQLPAEQHLTRALAVTREGASIRRIRRDMLGAFAVAIVGGVGFVVVTLDRFFEGDARYLVVAGGIMVSRSVLAAARGTVAGHRRFGAYGATIAYEGAALLTGGAIAAALGFTALGFSATMAVSPLACLIARPFADVEGHGDLPDVAAQRGSFLAWLIAATAASQLIIAGGPIAVSFIGGTAAAVSIFFTSFALLRGPVTSAYNLVARVLPDFTALAHRDDPRALWLWGPRIVAGAVVLAALGAIGSGLLLRPLIDVVYGAEFVPPQLAATLGGLGVGLGLGALFATQIYSATARGAMLASGWALALVAAVTVLVVSSLDPIDRAALAFAVGEGAGLIVLGLVAPLLVLRTRH